MSPPPPAVVEPAGLRISAVPAEMFQGSVILGAASWVDDQGKVFPRIPEVSWAVDDPTVVSANPVVGSLARNEALVTGLAPGSTRLRASAGGHAASMAIAVVPVLSGPPPALTVEFKVIEFPDPQDWATWTYAPQARITATGIDEIHVLGIRLEVPGLRSALQACTSTSLGGGETRELFPEVSGDFPLSLTGRGRASQRTATAFLSYSDGAGEQQTFRIVGPIEGRGIPRTVPGEPSRWTLCAGV